MYIIELNTRLQPKLKKKKKKYIMKSKITKRRTAMHKS